MALKLMYITNNLEIAKYAEKSGVNWIFIDLETIGKMERQGHVDSVKSNHDIRDIKTVKKGLKSAELLVRVNPINPNSKAEIEEVISNGADLIMLPFFKTLVEVEKFLSIVSGRVKTVLLLETPEAVEIIDDILKLRGIDFIHIGLNDLHLGYKMKFMFELLSDQTVEKLCVKIMHAGIPFGFGGVANLGYGDLPAELILTEHYRLKSEMVILARSFCNVDELNELSEAEAIFDEGIRKIRDYEKFLSKQDQVFYKKNYSKIKKIVKKIVQDKKNDE